VDAEIAGGLRPMSPEQASLLLSAVLGRHAAPIDRLLARCSASDGKSWSAGVLASGNIETTSLEGCRAMKDQAKADLAAPSEEGHDPAAFLRYLHAIAAAIDVHGTTISSAAPTEVASGLAATAPHLTEPWRDMFLRSAGRIRSQVV